MSLISVESEQRVIGAVLTGDWHEDCDEVAPEAFGEVRHVHIWQAVRWLRSKGRAVDELAVAERLHGQGVLSEVGGPAYLSSCTGGAFLGVGLRDHVATILDRVARRAVVLRARAAIAAAHDTNVEPAKVALDASGALADLGAAGTSQDFTFRDSLEDFSDRMGRVQSGEWDQYQPTYFRLWDDLLGGLERGKLILAGAYPSVGKSALEAAILLERAQRGHKDGLFTLEDPKLWIAKRYVAKATGIPVRRLMQRVGPGGEGRLSEWQLDKIGAAYDKAEPWWDNILIDERTNLSTARIVAKIRQWKAKHGVQCVWVDNASEVSLEDEGERHELRTAAMVRGLRDAAKVLDIPIVLLVHFKRPKGQTTKEPRFIRPTSDLWKNAGAFEEAARVAVGLWMDEDAPGGVVATILKQTEGVKDVDFWMKMNEPSGLLEPNEGYVVGASTGYSQEDAA